MVRGAILALLMVLSGLGTAVPASAADCTGSVVGRLILGYGNRGPVAGVRITMDGVPDGPDGPSGPLHTGADGSFRVDGIPLGWHNGAADHAQFAFDVSACGQTVDVGEVEYPLMHPAVWPITIGKDHPAAKALVAFLDAVLARNGPTTLAWVTDDLRSQAPYGFTGQSNPCLYRYAVLSLVEWTTATPDQPSPGAVEATVRIYTHFWPGDQAGGLPRSYMQLLTLVDTSAGWRVSALSQIFRTREEPNEPHGPHLSACYVGRRPVTWLIPSSLPATGGLSPTLASVAGLALIVVGSALRAGRSANH